MSMEHTYTYVTKPASDHACWDDVIQTYDSARKSLDGTTVILKWHGSKPASLPVDCPELTKAQMQSYIDANVADWVNDDM